MSEVTDKIVLFPVENKRFNKRKKPPASKGYATKKGVMEAALSRCKDLKNIAIVGVMKDGGLYVASTEEKEVATYLFEKAKHFLLERA